MTEQELKDIVAAVVAELEKSGVDFDYKADQAKDDDLVFVIRGTAPNYQGVTVTWKGLLDIITAQATQAKNDAETAKNAANTILEQVQSKGTEITNFVATSKTEIETQKNESVEEVRTVYQGDLNELKGDLGDLTSTTANIVWRKQLFDRSMVTVGRMETDGTINTGATGYVYTEKIDVHEHVGDTIRFSNDMIPREASRVTAFDSEENAVSVSGESSVSTYTVPSGIYYIVISYDAIRTHFQAEYGEITAYTEYGHYLIQKTDKTLLLSNVSADALAVKEKIDSLGVYGLIETIHGSNIYDMTNDVQGLLQSNGTVDASGGNAGYHTTDYIPIEASTSYNISVWSNGGASLMSGRIRTVLYDSDKVMVSGSYTNETELTNKTISNTTASYIRFSFSKSQSSTNVCMFIKGSSAPENYEHYYEESRLKNAIHLNDTEKGQVPFLSSALNEKKWCPCGDSFTAGSESAQFVDGKYAGKNKVYPYFIGNRTGINVQNKFFLSGRTLAYPSDGTFTNSICCPTSDCYYQNIPADADYVTFYLGINDFHHQDGAETTPDGEDATGVITLGTADSTDTGTYYGAWNTVLSWLRENRPFTHIGIIVTNGVNQTWREAQIAMARKYGIPFIDMNGDDNTPVMLRSCNENIPQSVRTAITHSQRVSSSNEHPNDNAHEFESHFIEAFIKRL